MSDVWTWTHKHTVMQSHTHSSHTHTSHHTLTYITLTHTDRISAVSHTCTVTHLSSCTPTHTFFYTQSSCTSHPCLHNHIHSLHILTHTPTQSHSDTSSHTHLLIHTYTVTQPYTHSNTHTFTRPYTYSQTHSCTSAVSSQVKR